jgi:hypothetical protein
MLLPEDFVELMNGVVLDDWDIEILLLVVVKLCGEVVG